MEKKVAVVIGNAGIKSLGAIPILSFLQRENLPIDLLIGSGGGASAAALFAMGFLAEEIPHYMRRLYDKNTMLKLNYNTLLDMSGLRTKKFIPGAGILNNRKLLETYADIFQNVRMEDLQIKTAIQTTDLLTGEGVVLRYGPLSSSIYASNATFPFFPPETINDRLLADGLFSGALPLYLAFKEDYDVIIAINFNQEYYHFGSMGLVEYYCNFFNRTYSASEISPETFGMMMYNTEVVMLTLNLSSRITLWSTERIPEIWAAGEKLLKANRQAVLKAFS